MAAATRTTKSGVTIEVKVVRDVRNRMLDGMVMGREISGYTEIKLIKGGKVIAQGDKVATLNPMFDAAMIEKGAVAQLGDAYLTEENAELVAEAVAEAEDAEPGSDEYQTLKAAAEAVRAANARRTEEEAEMMREMEEIERRMDDPNSDY